MTPTSLHGGLLRPGRSGRVLAALALAAALAASLGLAPALRAPLGFLLLGWIPGQLFARAFAPDDAPLEERALWALVLSPPLAILARHVGFAFHLPGGAFVTGFAILCAVGALGIPARRGAAPAADRVVLGIAAAAGLFVALPAALNLMTRVFGDAMVHAQFAYEIHLRGVPPQDPSYAGIPLNYMWQFHVGVAALMDATGLTPYQIFPWIGGAMMAALVLAGNRFAASLSASPLQRRLGALVLPLGMNALGWIYPALRMGVTSLVGETRGLDEIRRQLQILVLDPNANQVCGTLLVRGYFILCSLLYKYFCANALGAGLTTLAAAVALAAAWLTGGGRGRLVALAIASASAVLLHPLVGVPGLAALIGGLALAALVTRPRGPALAAAVAATAGVVIALPVIRLMLGAGLGGGEPTRLRPLPQNLVPLIQGLLLAGPLALAGWSAARRRAPALATAGAAFAVLALGAALVLDFPWVGEAYPVYVAYLGFGFFAGGGLALAIEWLSRHGHARLAWAATAFVLLPVPLLLFNGFARQRALPGLAGYPDTGDEIAVFDWLRDRTPADAVVIDLQYFASSSAAAYSGRRGWFGGLLQSDLVGYPHDAMRRRERAVVNLLLEPGLSDSTIAELSKVGAPLYVVARRTPPRDLLAERPQNPVDPAAKLDAIGLPFDSVLRTQSIVVYRWSGAAVPASNPGGRP